MTTPQLKLSVSMIDNVSVVSVSGRVDQTACGPLYDTLFDAIGKGSGKLIIDLAGVDLLTRAASRSLVVAAKLLQPPHGAMRICGARSGVAAMLDGLGHDYLIKRDLDLIASLAALLPERYGSAPRAGNAGAEPPMPANTNDDAVGARIHHAGGQS